MKKREPVSHIMSKQVMSVQTDTTLMEVTRLFKENNFHHLPVCKGNEVVGILSQTDLVKLEIGDLYTNQEGAKQALLEAFKAGQIMTPNPLMLQIEDTIKDAAEIFSNANFHALPVMENEKLVGIVSSKDVMKFLLTQF